MKTDVLPSVHSGSWTPALLHGDETDHCYLEAKSRHDGISLLLHSTLSPLAELNDLQYSVHEVEKRTKHATSHTDMLNRFLKLNAASPDKLSLQEVTGAIFINLWVRAFTEASSGKVCCVSVHPG